MRNTAQYILKRLLYMIPMVLVITFLIYGGLELTPGDAISHMIPPDQLANVNPEQLEALRFFSCCASFSSSLSSGTPLAE